MFFLFFSAAIASFVAVNDYDFGRAVTDRALTYDAELTVEAWFKLPAPWTPFSKTLLGLDDCANLRIGGGAKPLHVSLDVGFSGFSLGDAKIVEDEWTWVAFGLKSATQHAALYLNRLASSAQDDVGVCSGPRVLRIGFGQLMHNDYLFENALISHVRAWRSLLDDATLGTVYDRTLPLPLPCALLSEWAFLQAESGDATQAAVIDRRELWRLAPFYVRKSIGEPGCDPIAGCTMCPWPIQVNVTDKYVFAGAYTAGALQMTGCAPMGLSPTPTPTVSPTTAPTSAPTLAPSGEACGTRHQCVACIGDAQCKWCYHYEGLDSYYECHVLTDSCYALPSQITEPGETCPAPSPTAWTQPVGCVRPTLMPTAAPTTSPTTASHGGNGGGGGGDDDSDQNDSGGGSNLLVGGGAGGTAALVVIVIAAIVLIVLVLLVIVFVVRRRRATQPQHSGFSHRRSSHRGTNTPRISMRANKQLPRGSQHSRDTSSRGSFHNFDSTAALHRAPPPPKPLPPKKPSFPSFY